mmetsp:Transcript_12023/g.21108  ORF Transcript_12023/g.21108 Transcript_12023/m.21108 type:complete len:195 (-) Transcript_12023:34-618(-)
MNLVTACASGDLYMVAMQIKWGDDPNEPFTGIFPLQVAIEEGHVDVVAVLLYKGVNPDRFRPTMLNNWIERVKDPDSKRLIVKLLDDETFRRMYEPTMIAHFEIAAAQAAEATKRIERNAALVMTTLVLTFASLSAFVTAAPDAASKTLPKEMIDCIHFILSSILGVFKNCGTILAHESPKLVALREDPPIPEL